MLGGGAEPRGRSQTNLSRCGLVEGSKEAKKIILVTMVTISIVTMVTMVTISIVNK